MRNWLSSNKSCSEFELLRLRISRRILSIQPGYGWRRPPILTAAALRGGGEVTGRRKAMVARSGIVLVVSVVIVSR
jgi:hypothetical protein